MYQTQDTPTYFIHPLADFSFKRIFGTENNKELLIAFLNKPAGLPAGGLSGGRGVFLEGDAQGQQEPNFFEEDVDILL